MTPSTATRSIDVNVSGVNELKLIVTDAGDGNNSDHADWANARVTAIISTSTPGPTNTPTPTPTPTPGGGAVKLTGTAFGTSPAWNNGTDNYEKAFDGNTGTFFDYSQGNGGYTGTGGGPTPTPTPTPGDVKYNFENTMEGWTVSNVTSGPSSVTEWSYNGSYS